MHFPPEQLLKRLRLIGGGSATRHMPSRGDSGWQWAALVLAGFAAVPLLAVLWALPAGGLTAWGSITSDILPLYAGTTALLMILTGLIAAILGVGAAWLVTAARFPGRRILSWALVLPLAVPAYIAAYIYGDLLDFSGPVQSGLRDVANLQAGDYWFPPIRSLPGAAFVLGIVLYPYVYLLARASFAAQSLGQFRAARSLGLRPSQAFWRVVLPASRPAIAGGVALVLMETLADFGVVEYFGVPTFSTGIFRSWLAMGDKEAALKLAAVMLCFVALLIMIEATSRKGHVESKDAMTCETQALVKLSGPQAIIASLVCVLPVILGFAVPAITLASHAFELDGASGWRDLWSYAQGSVSLALIVAVIAVLAAFLLAYAQRRSNGKLTKGAIRLATLGYALPGALLAVGILAPLGVLDQAITRITRDSFGWGGGLVLAGSGAMLIYALSLRFLTVAFNSVSAGMAKLPMRMDAAARSLGAKPSRVMARIHLPQLRFSLAAGAALVFIDTMRELPATLILRPFNLETLATRVYRLASDERLAEASSAALVLLALGLIPVIMLNRSSR